MDGEGGEVMKGGRDIQHEINIAKKHSFLLSLIMLHPPYPTLSSLFVFIISVWKVEDFVYISQQGVGRWSQFQ
jgi:hypothetical protein